MNNNICRACTCKGAFKSNEKMIIVIFICTLYEVKIEIEMHK